MNQNSLATTALASILLLTGCAESPYDDPHAAPRDTQAWENIDLSGYSQEQLLAHLERLAGATIAAAAAGDSVEFHHLEVAMTPTLVALESKAAGNTAALKTIETLKPLAIKLHEAGHDDNVAIGNKLAAAISDLSARLAAEL